MKQKESEGLKNFLNGFSYACDLLDKTLYEPHFLSAKSQYLRTLSKNNEDTE